ncbi:MAG TPA: hypothetical protein VNC50_15390 [Planctomycetia bacterium]|jgi:hypothetical protein|nr:hypothetical protein [Planctomycetia bacterium]
MVFLSPPLCVLLAMFAIPPFWMWLAIELLLVGNLILFITLEISRPKEADPLGVENDCGESRSASP